MLSFLTTDPTVIVTVISSIALLTFISVITFFALAPVVSDTWAERLNAATHTGSLEPDVQHGD
ncbi:hypothetical protein [Natronosalvus vescus]|uniref:hypothetical protein n=1 Tax=Natronosalvus vescus TaxID=2953881 RepID=UPI002090E1CF|nr:hypothetical protein [Natronosalvus vescus]